MHSTTEERSEWWQRLPVVLRAIVVGLLVGLVPANVWLIFLFGLGMPAAAIVEALFLGAYVWWARGGGPPRRWSVARAESFRRGKLVPAQWLWGLIAALAFAGAVHAAIVVLFRLVPFPAADFHRGYDLSFVGGRAWQWVVVVVSAASAGICEEIGFRGYMQRPIERRHGPRVAILVSSALFTLVHLSKSWSTTGMVPIVFAAGLGLGTLAWASRSLIPCMVGHTVMDIGLFSYWWSQVAGTFTQRPIFETGLDRAFLVEVVAFVVTAGVLLTAIARLRAGQPQPPPDFERT